MRNNILLSCAIFDTVLTDTDLTLRFLELLLLLLGGGEGYTGLASSWNQFTNFKLIPHPDP